MQGLAGKAGWRWIFIIEGCITVLVGILGYFALVEFPDKARHTKGFLTDAQIDWVLQRLQEDRGDAIPERFSLQKFLRAGLDLRLWCFGVIFWCVYICSLPDRSSRISTYSRHSCLTTVSYCVSFFLPIILHGYMGFSVGASQCLTAPPYAFAGILMLLCGWVGDKYRIRGPLIILNALLCIVGLVVMTWSKSIGARYFGTFLVTAGVQANIPCAMAYQANNIRGQWTRAFGSATLVGFGGLGGISGSLIFRTQDAPKYLNGVYGCIV